jgi:gliding motility-associated-like protein
MKSLFLSKSFNSWIVKVCFAVFFISMTTVNAIATVVNIYGNVYNDLDGSAGSNKVDGTPIGSPGGTQLYATLVQGGVTVLSTAVDPTGIFYFMNQVLGNYTVLISTTNYAIGFVNPVPSLPSGWTFNGEIDNDSGNTLTGNTPPTDGILLVNLTTFDSNLNFGIIQSGSGATVTPGGPDNVCQSTSPTAITLSGASVGGLATTSAWSITSPSGSGTLSSTAQTTTPSTVTYTPAANFTGTVILTLTTNSNGFPAVSGTRTINVNPLPSSSITASNDACVGSSIVYTVLAGMSNYTWTVSSGGTISSGGGNSDNTVTVTWNTAGTENVSVNFTNGNGCTALDTRNVPVKALPTCSITGPDGPLSPSSSGNIYSAPPGKSYVWSISGNATIAGSTTSQSVSVTVGANCGVSFTLSLEITDLPGAVLACSSICNKEMTVSSNSISEITGTTTVCVGSTTQLTDLTNGGTWSSGSTGIATIDSSTGLVTAGTAGTAVITYSVTNSCGTTSVTSTITVNSLPTVEVITGPTTVCVGSTITLADATKFGSWSSASPGIATVSAGGAGGAGGLVTGVSAGTSLITYTVSNGNCSNSVTQLVTVTDIPIINGTHDGSVCGTGTVTLGAMSFTGTINWYDALTGGNLVGSGSSFTTPVISATTTYYVDATNNGCTTASRTAVVATVNPLPAVPVISGITTVCAGNDIQLTGSPSGGSWTSASPLIATVTLGGAGGPGGFIHGELPGTSVITYTVYSGSCSNSVSQLITVNDIPIVNSIHNGSVCGTGTILLGAMSLTGIINWYDALNGGNLVGSGSSFTTPVISTTTTYYVDATNNGCTTASRTAVVATVNAPPTTPILTFVTQPTCAVGTGSITVTTQLPTDSLSFDNGVTFQTSSIKSGLTAGNYNVIIKSIGGCNSVATPATINALPDTPATPIIETVTQPTCSTATGSVVLSGLPSGNWTINPGAISGSTSSKTIPSLTSGTYNYSVTNSTGCVSAFTADIVIAAQPLTPTIPVISVTQPTCAVGTGSISVIVQNVTDSYSFDNGGSFQTSNIKSGLVPGNYNVIIKSIGGCNSVATSATINALPDTPSTPIIGTVTQPTCSLATGSVVLSGLPSGNWTINPGSITGSTSNTTISGLTTGTYNYSVTNSAGCVSAFSADIAISAQPLIPTVPILSITQPTCAVGTGTITVTVQNATDTYSFDNGITFQSSNIKSGLVPGNYSVIIKSIGGCNSVTTSATINALPDTPSTPIVGTVTQPTCSTATGSVVLSGLPGGNWTINPGAITGSTSSTTISGLAAGNYNYSLTNSTGCVSAFTADIVIATQPQTPTIPVISVTQPTCAVGTGTITVTVQNATDNYSFDNGGSFQTSNIKSGLVSGFYSVIIKSIGGCNSVATSATINALPDTPSTPIIGTVTQPTCSVATGSVVLSGLPSGNWTINPGTISGSTSSKTISGLTTGTYNYSVTNSTGCVSAFSADIVIATQPLTPTIPVLSVTQPTCAVGTGSISVTVQNGSDTYSFDNGGSFQTSNIKSGLVSGNYNVIIKSIGGCNSGATSATINALPDTPSTPIVGTITQPTCSLATGSIVLSGLPSGNWTINPGTFTGSTSSKTISGLIAGTYSYSVTNSTGCISAFTADIVIAAQPQTPTVPIITSVTQPTCAVGTGGISVTVQNGSDMYSFDNGESFQTSNIKSGLTAGNYNVIIKSIGGCNSVATSATINALPETPSTPISGTVTQPTCSTATGSVVLSGLPSGNWTINPGAITGSTSSTTISGLAAGTYNYSVTNSTGCVSAFTADIVIAVQPLTPTIPVLSVTQPTCAIGTGRISVTVQNATDTYSFDNGVSFQSSNIKSGLVHGNYNVIIKSIGGCNSVVTAATINALPNTPSTPIVGTITQPTCSLATGSVVLSGLPSGNWTINPVAITGSTSSTTISGLTTETYNYSVTNSTGCVSAFTADIVIAAQPLTPTIPVISVTQPTCAIGTGSISVTVQNGSDMYSFDNGGSFQTSNIKSGLTAGTYKVIIKSIGGCNSGATSATINALPDTPSTPIVGTITQPTCSLATGSVVLSGLPSGNWTINPGNITGSTSSTTISGLTADTYNYSVTNSTGCVSAFTADIVISAQPLTPTVPILSVTQPTCAVGTGSITVTTQFPTDSFSFDNGVTYQTSNIKSGLIPGSYNVIIKSIGGCSSVATSTTINALPDTPSTPIVGTITQPTCSLATASVVLSGLPGSNWTINPGSITGSTSSTTISGLTTGTYNYSVTNSTGCVSAFTADIIINAQPLTPTDPVITVTQPTCALPTGSITVTTPTGSNLTYSIGGNYQTSVIFNDIATGTYSVTSKNSAGCISSPTIFSLVTPNCNNIDLVVVETVNTSIVTIGQTVVFKIVATNNGPDNATGTSVIVKLPSGFTFVSTSNTIGTYDSQSGLWTIGNMNNGATETLTITATVNATGSYSMTAVIKCDEVESTLVNNTSTAELVPIEFFIPDAFTPNGDGFNDLFEIKHPATTKIEIEIFNRWGNSVYKSDDYQNDWDGKGSGNFLGKDLPVGTYYCIYKELNASTGEIVLKGVKYITLRR